jgi:maltose O-acetyltransferase
VIICGVEIGEGVLVGAGTVVTKNLPKNCLAYGNPAKIIKLDKNEKV